MKKILYIAKKYSYGKPENGLSYEYYNFFNTLKQMPEYKIIYFPFDEIMISSGKEFMNRELIDVFLKESPEYCFFILSHDEIDKKTIKEISKHKTKTINFFGDDTFRFHYFSRYYAPLFHWICTAYHEALPLYKKIGVTNIIETQFAVNHHLYKPENIKRDIDVSFVGRFHRGREKIIRKLKKAGINVYCRGPGWPDGHISQEDMVRIFSRSKINLNLSNTGFFMGSFRGLIGIFFRKGGLFGIRTNTLRVTKEGFRRYFFGSPEQIKGRNFEVPACRGFLITSDASNLREYYEDGKEIVIFNNVNDLIKKIKYYLKHEVERETIAEAGYLRTIQDHTYEKRLRRIFEIIDGTSVV